MNDPWGYKNRYSFSMRTAAKGHVFVFSKPNAVLPGGEEWQEIKTGGPRPVPGGKEALADKITEGKAGGKKLSVIEFSNAANLEGQEMPKPRAMLSATQKDGKTLEAAEIYERTWQWLNERGCSALVSPMLLERFAMSAARWIQCEAAVSEYGFLAKHPTTGAAIASPYVSMSHNFMNQTNRLWLEIFQIVKENCTGEYSGANPQDDVMERLLTARKGR